MKNILLVFAILFSIQMTSCTNPEIIDDGKINNDPQSFFNDRAIASNENLDFEPINIPISNLKFPSIWIDGIPDHGCFSLIEKPDTLRGPQVLNVISNYQNNIDGSLTGDFSNSLIKVGLRATLVDSLIRNMRLETKGVALVKINPSLVKFNFTVGSCENIVRNLLRKHTLMTGAYFSDSVLFRTNYNLTQSQTADLNAAFARINTEFQVNFSHFVSSNNQKYILGHSLFFGIKSSKILEKRDYNDYTLRGFKPGKSKDGNYNSNKKNYKFHIEKNNSDDSLTIEFWDAESVAISTGKVTIACNGGHNYGFCGDNMIVNFNVVTANEDSKKYKLNITTQFISAISE